MIQDIIGCLVHGPSAAIRPRRGSSDFEIVIGNDVPYRLAGPTRIALHARMLLRGSHHPGEPDPWRVQIVGYQHTLLDQDQHEILAFHLHPEGPSRVVTPHLHLGAGAGQLRDDLSAAHLPTGPVTLAAVARLTIEAFAARPLRVTWDDLLRRSHLALSESRGQ